MIGATQRLSLLLSRAVFASRSSTLPKQSLLIFESYYYLTHRETAEICPSSSSACVTSSACIEHSILLDVCALAMLSNSSGIQNRTMSELKDILIRCPCAAMPLAFVSLLVSPFLFWRRRECWYVRWWDLNTKCLAMPAWLNVVESQRWVSERAQHGEAAWNKIVCLQEDLDTMRHTLQDLSQRHLTDAFAPEVLYSLPVMPPTPTAVVVHDDASSYRTFIELVKDSNIGYCWIGFDFSLATRPASFAVLTLRNGPLHVFDLTIAPWDTSWDEVSVFYVAVDSSGTIPEAATHRWVECGLPLSSSEKSITKCLLLLSPRVATPSCFYLRPLKRIACETVAIECLCRFVDRCFHHRDMNEEKPLFMQHPQDRLYHDLAFAVVRHSLPQLHTNRIPRLGLSRVFGESCRSSGITLRGILSDAFNQNHKRLACLVPKDGQGDCAVDQASQNRSEDHCAIDLHVVKHFLSPKDLDRAARHVHQLLHRELLSDATVTARRITAASNRFHEETRRPENICVADRCDWNSTVVKRLFDRAAVGSYLRLNGNGNRHRTRGKIRDAYVAAVRQGWVLVDSPTTIANLEDVVESAVQQQCDAIGKNGHVPLLLVGLDTEFDGGELFVLDTACLVQMTLVVAHFHDADGDGIGMECLGNWVIDCMAVSVTHSMIATIINRLSEHALLLLHGASNDLHIFERQFGLNLKQHAVIDTAIIETLIASQQTTYDKDLDRNQDECSQFLHHRGAISAVKNPLNVGLGTLMQRYLDHHEKKSTVWRYFNWSSHRPLDHAAVAYAATDSIVLPYILLTQLLHFSNLDQLCEDVELRPALSPSQKSSSPDMHLGHPVVAALAECFSLSQDCKNRLKQLLEDRHNESMKRNIAPYLIHALSSEMPLLPVDRS